MTLVSEQAAFGVRPGDVLAGKYRIERVLGAGGMGVVIAAHHVQLDERVAIKFLLPQALQNAQAIERFEREARAAVKIKSEHVARVLDVGTLESGAPYMVMEYLEGQDLARWLHERGPLPLEQCVDFVLQACEAIAEAHALGIVHRDLKPANLFCIRRPDGSLSVKVLDFGISKVIRSDSQEQPTGGMTGTHAIMGSPYYMSPEQMRSTKAVDARTDLWSLGAILFELTTGQTPFNSLLMTELILQIATAPAPSPRSLRSDLPEAFERVVLRCLEKEPSDRYANVAELARALAPFAPAPAQISVQRIAGVLRTSIVPPAAAPHAEPFFSLPDPSVQPSPPTLIAFGHTWPGKSRTKALAVGGVLAVALVGAAAVAALRLARVPSASKAAAASLPTESASTAALPSPPASSTTAQAPVPSASAATADKGAESHPAQVAPASPSSTHPVLKPAVASSSRAPRLAPKTSPSSSSRGKGDLYEKM